MSSPTDDQNKLTSKTNSDYIKLNVGGMHFHTTISTLTKFKENMLAAMFSGRMERTIDEEGCVFIDRSGKHFGVILNFLRDGTVPLPSVKVDLAELRAEANFFCISELVELCDQALVPPMNMHGFGPIYFIAMPKPLDEKVVKSLTKPAIILQIRTESNFPSQHVEFFEQLSFGYHEIILFIRYPLYTIPRECKCVWNFYSNGQLLDNIGCSHDVTENSIRIRLEKLLLTLIPKS